MPRTTLYIKESDTELFERAQNELGESLSSVFADCLRKRMEEQPRAGEMQKIRLVFWDENQQPSITKSFTGRWLVGDAGEGLRTLEGSWDGGAEWSIAQTAKGNLVVYLQHCNERWAPKMTIYDSFDDLETAEIPKDILAQAAAGLGVPYEIDLDI